MPGDVAHTCGICGLQRDYICERCLRCEHCCGLEDVKRRLEDQHLGKWLWHCKTYKGVQLTALQCAGHGKGDYPGTSQVEQKE